MSDMPGQAGDERFIGGYLGAILGGTVGAMLVQGTPLAEIHQLVDLAAESKEAAVRIAAKLRP